MEKSDIVIQQTQLILSEIKKLQEDNLLRLWIPVFSSLIVAFVGTLLGQWIDRYRRRMREDKQKMISIKSTLAKEIQILRSKCKARANYEGYSAYWKFLEDSKKLSISEKRDLLDDFREQLDKDIEIAIKENVIAQNNANETIIEIEVQIANIISLLHEYSVYDQNNTSFEQEFQLIKNLEFPPMEYFSESECSDNTVEAYQRIKAAELQRKYFKSISFLEETLVKMKITGAK